LKICWGEKTVSAFVLTYRNCVDRWTEYFI